MLLPVRHYPSDGCPDVPSLLFKGLRPQLLSATLNFQLNIMRPVFSLIVWSLAAYVFYSLLRLSIAAYQRAVAAKSRGCRPAPTYPSPDPTGILNAIKIVQANNAGRLNHHVVERIDTVSKQEGRPVWTFQTHIARSWLFFTCDPKNIQALLATQFKDFELGPIRFGTFNGLYVFSAQLFRAYREGWAAAYFLSTESSGSMLAAFSGRNLLESK
jgi:hypothetical protein